MNPTEAEKRALRTLPSLLIPFPRHAICPHCGEVAVIVPRVGDFPKMNYVTCVSCGGTVERDSVQFPDDETEKAKP
jgi:transcription elongation factor Elf1